MALNFATNTLFWRNLNSKRKRLFDFAFGVIGDDFRRKRGDIVKLVKACGVSRPTAERYLNAITLAAAVLEGRERLEFVESRSNSGDVAAKEALLIYADVVAKKKHEAANLQEELVHKEEKIHPAIASLDEARRIFLDVVSGNVTLETENASLKAENETLKEEVVRLCEDLKALRVRLESNERKLASARSALSYDSDGNGVKTEPPAKSAKKAKADEEKGIIVALNLPTSTPAILPWANRVVPIQYSARFLKALDALHPETRMVVVQQILNLIERGRKETHSSQNHEKYNGHMVRVPEGTMISRGTKSIRYLWEYKIDEEKRQITFHMVGKHTEFWKSEK